MKGAKEHGSHSAPTRIALHLGLPRCDAVTQAGLDSPAALFLFAAALRAVLGAEIAAGAKPGIEGDIHDGLFTFETTSPGVAVEKLRRFCRTEAASLAGFTEIAWWCEAEQAWRVIHRGPDPSPFESRLTEERRALRYAASQRIIEALNRIADQLPPAPPQ